MKCSKLVEAIFFSVVISSIVAVKTFHINARGRRHNVENDVNSPPQRRYDQNSMLVCEVSMNRCHTPMQPYNTKDVEHLFGIIRQNGITDICGAALDTLGCLIDKLNGPLCAEVFDRVGYIGVFYRALMEGRRFVCEQNFEQIEANRNCIFDFNVLDDTRKCFMLRGRDYDQCDTTALEQCGAAVVESADHCSAEARSMYVQLLREIHKVEKAGRC